MTRSPRFGTIQLLFVGQIVGSRDRRMVHVIGTPPGDESAKMRAEPIFVFVNNRLEGFSPATIAAIIEGL